MHQPVYLDNNATTPVHPDVINAYTEALQLYGNPSSMHQEGQKAMNAIEAARGKIASFIGAKPDEIIFTGSGSEANNSVFHSIYWNENPIAAMERDSQIIEPPHVITTAIEHPSVLNTLEYYEKHGMEVTFLPVKNNGIVDIENVLNAIRPNTRLISVMYANNEIGTIQPVKEIGKLAKQYNIYFHTDAVQAMGKLPIDVNELGVNYLTLSGHKIYAPKGIAALYVKKGTRFYPFVFGGHHENYRRAGTENTPGIIAFGKATELLEAEMDATVQRMYRLKEKLKYGLQNKIHDISFNGDQDNCLPNTLNVTFDYVEGESILLYADFEGIQVSTGSACSTGSLEPSHVIMALGKDPEKAHGSVRFSLGRETTEEDIEYVVDKFPAIIDKLRKMSPLYNF
jgi:cysteine desulfurase